MPRWKRKSQYYKRKSPKHYANGGEDGGIHYFEAPPKGVGFTDAEKSQLVKYLVDYKRGCERICCCAAVCLSDEETVVTAPAAASPTSYSGRKGFTMIGEIRFPELTEEIFSRPYLRLPKILSSKQRRCVHEVCVDVDLYHVGVGPTHTKQRYVVISIHSDGFRYVEELNQDSPTIPIQTCRPWFCSTNHPEINDESTVDGTTSSISTPPRTNASTSVHPYVLDATRRGRSKIEALLDQPGDCLRDGVDVIDFKEMDSLDLSHIAPPDGDTTSWMLVDSAEKMKQCVQELTASKPTEIGLDMEMYNLSKYTQFTCLIQLAVVSTTNETREYVIDTLAPGVWKEVSQLAPFFADPAIVKIGHSIGSLDVRSLHRDFGIFVVNAFDTYEAARALKLKCGLGLASLCKHYKLQSSQEYASLKARYQTTDWRRRPLTPEMIRYGRYDVHYLVPLRKLLMRDLTRAELWDNVGLNKDEERRMIARALASTLKRIEREEDDVVSSTSDLDVSMDVSTVASNLSDDEGYYTPPTQEDPNGDVTRKSEYGAAELRMQADLMRVISHSQQRCLDLWSSKTEQPTKNDTFVSVIYRAGKGEMEWTPSHMALYEDLVHWRDAVARKEEVLPGLVCSLTFLVSVAVKRPTCEASLRLINYFLPQLLEDAQEEYMRELLSLVRESLLKDGLNPVSVNTRKYSIPDNESKPSSIRRRLALSLGVVVVVGAAAAAVVVLSRQRRRR